MEILKGLPANSRRIAYTYVISLVVAEEEDDLMKEVGHSKGSLIILGMALVES